MRFIFLKWDEVELVLTTSFLVGTDSTPSHLFSFPAHAQTGLIRDAVEAVPTTRGDATTGRDAFHRVRKLSFVSRFIF